MDKMEHKMHEMKAMKCQLIDAMKAEFSKGMEMVNVDEAGKVIDMIKDLAEAEAKCWEAEYYKTVVEAMDEGEDPRYGYNNRRYANGRYAPSGRGMVRGFRPFIDQEPYIDAYLHDTDFPEIMRRGNNRMGYGDGEKGMNDNTNGRDGYSDDRRYGQAYNNYRNSRKYYTETHAATEKEAMHRHANEHVMDTIATMRDIWASAEPEQRKKMKQDFQNLLNEMTV